MNALIRLAISYVKEFNIENLLEIIEATGNPEVAAETLLGVYQFPVIPAESEWNNKPATYISYDKYKDILTFSYPYIETCRLYFATDEAAAACDTYDTTRGRNVYNQGDWSVEKCFEITKTHTNTTTLNSWLSGAEKLAGKLADKLVSGKKLH